MRLEDLTEEQKEKNLKDALNQFFYLFCAIFVISFICMLFRATDFQDALITLAAFLLAVPYVGLGLIPIKIVINLPDIVEGKFKVRQFIHPKYNRGFIVACLILATNMIHFEIGKNVL